MFDPSFASSFSGTASANARSRPSPSGSPERSMGIPLSRANVEAPARKATTALSQWVSPSPSKAIFAGVALRTSLRNSSRGGSPWSSRHAPASRTTRVPPGSRVRASSPAGD